jgi:type I restriction enzyme S subunit
MDAGLAALDLRRAKTHALKQGMMLELLTGKTRLL